MAKIGNFWYKFAQNGYIPLSNFYKIWYEEGVPAPHPRAKFNRSGLKMCNLWYKFDANGKSWGSIENLNIGAQLQIFLYAMTP